MISRLVYLLCVLSVMAFAGCKSGQKSPDKGDTLVYKTEQWMKRNGSDTNTTVSISYPVFDKRGAIQDSIDSYVKLYAFGNLPAPQLFTDSFFRQRNHFVEENPGAPTGWSHEAKATLLNNYPGLVTLEVNYAGFMGGAYPNFTRHLHNFGHKGDRLIWKDFLNAGQDIFLEKLNAGYLKQDLVRKQIIADTGAAWAEAGLLLENNRIVVPDNFALIPGKGLLMYYNTYDIAPRVMGDFEYIIPVAELKGMLKDEWWAFVNKK